MQLQSLLLSRVPFVPTTGTVTVTNAVAITGTSDEVTAALVTAGTLVDVTDATVTISNPSITDLNAIAAKTTGVVTATLAAASLADLGALPKLLTSSQ